MAFPLSDLRRTVRRGRGGETTAIYPRLLRGVQPLPKIAVAIRYFESMLGKRRGDMDPGVLVEFFADARLARCVVACLTRAYRYRTRSFAEVVGEERAQRLAEDGITEPRALRLRLYAHANGVHHGFIPPHRRQELLQPLLDRWQLDLHQLDTLLALDLEEERLLERTVRAAPEPADVAALYNYHTVETLLRAASRVALDAPTIDRAALKHFKRLTARYGVSGRLERHGRGVRFILFGRQDVLGSWVRHGGRVVRALVRLLAATTIDSGEATVELAGKSYQLDLHSDLLDILGAKGPGETAASDAAPLDETLEKEFRQAFGALRKQGLASGWTVRAAPEPVVLDQCIFLPDLALAHGSRRVLLAFATTAPAARALADVLPALAGKAPVVALVSAGLRPLLGDAAVPTLAFEEELPVFELVALLRSNVTLSLPSTASAPAPVPATEPTCPAA